MSTLVKICGLTSLEDASHALESGADYLGFVTYHKSPRYVSVDKLFDITSALPDHAQCIGVFVNTSRRDVHAIAELCNLYAVQIHGDEEASEFRNMERPVWRALRLENDTVHPDPEEWMANRYVLDAAPAGVYGGAGITVDPAAASQLAAEHSVFLAGGLTPDNVADAIQSVSPLGVDTSSGVEASPGRKDPEKVATFIQRSKQA